MTRKSLLPDDFGYSITLEQFSKLVRSKRHRLKKIETAISTPDEPFRTALIQILWFFYSKSIPVSVAMFSRAELMKELRNAASLAKQLEVSADRIWRSRDQDIFDLHSRFGGISVASGNASEPMHPSGVPFVETLGEFARAASSKADKLYRSRAGGQHPAAPFDELLIGLVRCHRKMAPSDKASFQHLFRFAAAVTDLLRDLQVKLPSATFKLPKNTETERPLRDRLRIAVRKVKAADDEQLRP